MGGRSAEREISLQSGMAVLRALQGRHWDALAIVLGDVNSNLQPWQQIEAAEIDRVFVALHGRYGEDGCIQGFLETIGVPYTGSGVLPSALAMDKVLSKRLFAAAGIPTPAFVYPAALEPALELGFPLVIKPRAEGSSVGLQIVDGEQALGQALQNGSQADLMVEAFVPGRELSVGVLGSGARARALGTIEIRCASGIYDYEAKYEREDTEYLIPAPLAAEQTRRLEELALGAHRLLGCCGATRVDFRWSGEPSAAPQLLEINTLPGMTDHSLLPKIAAWAGMAYGELVEALLADAGLRA